MNNKNTDEGKAVEGLQVHCLSKQIKHTTAQVRQTKTS